MHKANEKQLILKIFLMQMDSIISSVNCCTIVCSNFKHLVLSKRSEHLQHDRDIL